MHAHWVSALRAVNYIWRYTDLKVRLPEWKLNWPYWVKGDSFCDEIPTSSSIPRSTHTSVIRLTFGSDRSTSVIDRGTFGEIWALQSCFLLPSCTIPCWCLPSQSFPLGVARSWENTRYSVSGLRQVCWAVPHAGLLSPGLLQRWWRVCVGVAPPGRVTISVHWSGVVFSWDGRVEDLPRYSLLSDLYGTSR